MIATFETPFVAYVGDQKVKVIALSNGDQFLCVGKNGKAEWRPMAEVQFCEDSRAHP